MVNPDAAVRGLMREVGAALRPMGFRGSGGLWRLVTAEGVAVVHKQGSHGSWWDAKSFYINTAVVLKQWWAWKHGSHAGAGQITRAGEADGLRLLEGRVTRPTTDPAQGSPELWLVTPDTDLDRLTGDLVTGVTKAGRRLVELLEPGRYLDELLALPGKQPGHFEALVVLLADRGPSPELDTACDGLHAAFADRPWAAGHVDRLIARARARASHMAGPGG